MPLYMCQPPTGYKDTADAWVNTGALVSRMNFALALAGGQMRGVVGCDGCGRRSTSRDVAQRRRVATTTRATIAQGDRSRRRSTALTLGAPEFQTDE